MALLLLVVLVSALVASGTEVCGFLHEPGAAASGGGDRIDGTRDDGGGFGVEETGQACHPVRQAGEAQEAAVAAFFFAFWYPGNIEGVSGFPCSGGQLFQTQTGRFSDQLFCRQGQVCFSNPAGQTKTGPDDGGTGQRQSTGGHGDGDRGQPGGWVGNEGSNGDEGAGIRSTATGEVLHERFRGARPTRLRQPGVTQLRRRTPTNLGRHGRSAGIEEAAGDGEVLLLGDEFII